ncbi:eukaryotic translation initiation factor 4E family member 2 related sequence 1 isoform X3 [Phyllopteryx taeniolatus]|uniref:eukaryotic translation initiation factor 4E family member 2 related sequence 1 isoform X3 n=1 Tax=Phyllopteryx taeniolatus TaxID=161469 RepID=UPI002AD201A5|nr:eukaryotic translation initiation factor 4E family member 2 related sequence 1 isoform X3 [Phyllopteryx taeniolatus]
MSSRQQTSLQQQQLLQDGESRRRGTPPPVQLHFLVQSKNTESSREHAELRAKHPTDWHCGIGGAVLEVLQSSGASRRAEWTQRLPLVQGGHQAYVGGSVSSSQDEYNRSGGKWIIRLRKGLASRFWENIILAMVGEQFMVGEEICGAVVSIRFQEDFLSIWNRTSSDHITTSRIRDTLRRVLNLPANTIMEYKTHNDSLRDNSSFRNTKMSL